MNKNESKYKKKIFLKQNCNQYLFKIESAYTETIRHIVYYKT